MQLDISCAQIMEPFRLLHHAEEGTWWGTPFAYHQTLLIESWGVFAVGGFALLKVNRKGVLLLLSWFLSSIAVLVVIWNAN